MGLGIAIRLLRIGLDYPLWRDEAYLAVNLLERDFARLAEPLDFQQVCPLLFLWAEKAMSLGLGCSEWSLRVLPTIASIASLFLLRHVAGRLFTGITPVVAVAILAIAYTPIRHGGEIKPYATDFLVSLGLIALAVESLRRPSRTRPLWLLAAVGPLAIGLSNPAIFVAAGVGVVLPFSVYRSRSPRSIGPLILYELGVIAGFLVLSISVNAAQRASVMGWMRIYWAKSFPPDSFWPLLAWLVRVHTSHAFAYPAGGDLGASSLTTALVVVGILAFLRRGSKTVLALLLTPFALGLTAAFLGLYPYGGSARTMQYVAPSIILLASLGVAVLIERLPEPRWRDRTARLLLSGCVVIGLGMMVWDVAHPYKEPPDRASRDFARRFWAEEGEGAELCCARTDLHLPLNPLTWRGDRAAIYLFYQARFRGQQSPADGPRLGSVGESHPLRIVAFGATPADGVEVLRWVATHAPQLRLLRQRERVLNPGLLRGKASAEERYVIYDFIPARPPGG